MIDTAEKVCSHLIQMFLVSIMQYTCLHTGCAGENAAECSCHSVPSLSFAKNCPDWQNRPNYMPV